MTFTRPLALLLGLLAIAVVALYWLRVRLRRRSVATSMFWEQVFAEERARSRWQPLRHRVSLGVQLFLLALVVLALAGPRIPRPKRTVLIVQDGASMSATDVQTNRLEAAKDAARRLIDGMHDGDEMAILSAGAAPALLVAMTADAGALHRAVDSLAPAPGKSDVKDALELSRAMPTSEDGKSRVVVLGDGCFEGATDTAREVEFLQVGTRAANSGITRLEARRAAADPEVCQLLVEVRHFADQPREARLALTLDGKPVATETLQLSQGKPWQKVFEVKSPDAGQLAARLDPPDAYAADNEATAQAPPLVMHEVVLSREAGPYLRSALSGEANPRVKLADAERPTGREIQVLEGPVPEKLPPGRLLVIGPSGACDLWRPGTAVADPTVIRQADDSPVTAGVRLVDSCWAEAEKLELTEAARPVARAFAWTADGTPLGYSIDREQGRVVVLCGNLAASSLVGKPALPALLANALDWLQSAGGDRGAGVSPATDCSQDGNATTGSRDRCAAIDLRAPVDLGTEAASVPAQRPGPALWLYPAAAALALFVVEWVLYQRRWIS